MPDRILTSHAGSLPRPGGPDRAQPAARGGRDSRRGGLPGASCAAPSSMSSPASGRPASTWSTTASTATRWATTTTTARGGPTSSSASAGSSWRDRRAAPTIRAGQTAQAGRGRLAVGFAERRDWKAVRRRLQRPELGRRAAEPATGRSRRSAAGRSPTPGSEALARDIANLKAALAPPGVAEGFMNSVAPASCARFANEYYADRRGAALRVRRRDARGVQGDHRRRA